LSGQGTTPDTRLTRQKWERYRSAIAGCPLPAAVVDLDALDQNIERPDRLPVVALPPGLALLPMEGAGEVQTPLRVGGEVKLELGDPVFLRHAKAGELAEHFNEYLLLRGHRIETRAPTYRGLGQCFLG
jgi:D-serine deaminase-like pyridoxal phosphate-dependent protein